MINVLTNNVGVFVACLGSMWRAPLPTIFTVASVGIILALPAGLLMLSDNLESTSKLLQQTPEITVFLTKNTSDENLQRVHSKISKIEQVHQIELVSADEALNEFKELTGLNSVLEYIPENPLPAVLLVQLKEEYTDAETFENISVNIQSLDHVDSVQIDLEWVRRLNAILEIARIGSTVISVLLIVAAVLLICNSTRVSISNRMDEILVIDHVGGTQSFIRRPFVYTAILHSLLAVLFASAIIEFVEHALRQPINDLAKLYNNEFRFTGIAAQTWFEVAIAVALLSWIATRITVFMCLHRLRNSEP